MGLEQQIVIVATIARIAIMIFDRSVWMIMLKGTIYAALMPSQEPIY